MKKLFSVLLCMCMLCGMMPIGIVNAAMVGTGQTENFAFDWDYDHKTITITGYIGSESNLEIPKEIWFNGIPFDVVGIADYAFAGNQTIVSARIDYIDHLSDGVFADCDRLETVVIEKTVQQIGEKAFSSCDSLTSVTLGSAVTEIGEYAFSDCTSDFV